MDAPLSPGQSPTVVPVAQYLQPSADGCASWLLAVM